MGFATVLTFTDTTKAHMARGRLEAAGIKAFLHDEHLTQSRIGRLYGSRGVKLVVAHKDLPAARRVLIPPRDYGEATCPACLSGRLTKRRGSVVLAFLMALFMGADTPPARVRCDACGHTPDRR